MLLASDYSHLSFSRELITIGSYRMSACVHVVDAKLFFSVSNQSTGINTNYNKFADAMNALNEELDRERREDISEIIGES